MTPAEHRARAEADRIHTRRLGPEVSRPLAAAQVHATLALGPTEGES